MRISIYGTCLMNQKQYKPGAWLIQIKDAGHQLMSQYPDERLVTQYFLEKNGMTHSTEGLNFC